MNLLPIHVVERLKKNDFDVQLETSAPNVISGVVEVDTLLPVSKFTGRREDPLTLLKSQFSKDSRLLDALLQQLPTIPSDPNLSDEDKVMMLAGKFDQGTPADNDALVQRLMSVSDMLFPQQTKAAVDAVVDAAKESGVDTINFKESE